MPAELSVAPLLPQHWPEVSAIYRAGIETGHATFETTPPDWNTFDAAKLKEHRFVAIQDGSVVGWVAVSAVSSRCVYAGVVEHSVYVAPAAQGRGVARRLLAELIASTEQAGIWTIESGIFPENTASLRLHEALGFRVVGLRERVALMTHGPMTGCWRDIVLLERRSDVAGRTPGERAGSQ